MPFGGNAVGFNTFVPNFDASGKLVVHYSRDPKKFALNRYIALVPTKKMAGFYVRISPQIAARVLHSRPEEAVWPDGTFAPRGAWNAIMLDWQQFSCQRYVTPYQVGELTVETADLDILAVYRADAAQQAMTRRTVLVARQLLNTANWEDHVAANASALGTGGSVYAGTPTDPRFKLLLQEIGIRINRDTAGKVTNKELQVVINPNTAAKLSRTQEIHAYLKESPYALGQIRGDVESQNGVWGLPDVIYGFSIVVEDAVVIRYPRTELQSGGQAGVNAGEEYPSGEAPVTYAIPDDTLLVLARPGSLVTPVGPSFSTVSLFVFQEMLVEERYDQDNKLYMGRVIDTIAPVVTAPASGYLVSNIAA